MAQVVVQVARRDERAGRKVEVCDDERPAALFREKKKRLSFTRDKQILQIIVVPIFRQQVARAGESAARPSWWCHR